MSAPDETAPASRWNALAWKYLQGASLRELAAREGITVDELQKEIYDTVVNLVTEWTQLKLSWLEQSHARLLLLERETWAQWEQSKRPHVKVTRKEVRDARGERTETTTITEESPGDPRYLTMIFKCLALRKSLESQIQSHPTQPTRTPAEARAAVLRIIEQVRERQAQIDARKRQAEEIERTVAWK